ESAGRSECIFRIARPRCDSTRHRSSPKAADRLWTSTSSTLSCTHSRPCPPDPASLPHRARDCKPPPPAPGRPNPHAGPTAYLDNPLLSACPFSAFFLTPVLLSSSFLVRQPAIDRVSSIELLNRND